MRATCILISNGQIFVAGNHAPRHKKKKMYVGINITFHNKINAKAHEGNAGSEWAGGAPHWLSPVPPGPFTYLAVLPGSTLWRVFWQEVESGAGQEVALRLVFP